MDLLLIAIILGIVQGLTEFLPVSSSGHLVIFQFLFKVENIQLLLSIAVHFGTLLAVLIFFYKDLLSLFTGFFSGLADIIRGKSSSLIYRENFYFKTSLFIIIGSIPAAIAGLTLKDVLEETFSSVELAGFMLLITASFLFFTKRITRDDRVKRIDFPLHWAIIIGIAQAFALLPGISRSGATISAALFLGLEREWSARFSFLLSVPAIFGAFCLELTSFGQLDHAQLIAVLVGILTATIVGYLSLIVLMKIVIRGSFYRFSYYCFAVGTLAIILGLIK